MIKQEIINDIIDKADIVEVLSDFVNLKQSGANFKTPCPFHEEQTPSFIVSPTKQIYKCFGCGESGNVIKFLMKFEKRSFPEALRYLADKYNIILEEEPQKSENKDGEILCEKLFQLNELAAKYYHTNSESDIQPDYLRKRFSKEEIDQWQIGLATGNWNDLAIYFKSLNVEDIHLSKSNLFKFSEKKNNYYDFFQNRIIFPILNISGRIAGFGGRTINDNQIKYLNSPESHLYQKSKLLYGLNFARKNICQENNCNIVEGYTDVISMHTAGITNTVAPCGTSLSIEQLKLIKRYTVELTLIYDGDNAGLEAARKNGEFAIENGFNVYICLLPKGEDPDSFIKKNNDAKKWIEENRKDFILYQADTLLNLANEDLMLKDKAIGDISRLIFDLDKTKQQIYIDQISKEKNLKAKLFRDKLSLINAKTPVVEKQTWLPDNVNPNDFEKWGFYEFNNEYYFRTKDGIKRLSNFVMKPIFHIDSIYDSRRIFEMINRFGYRVVVNLDMSEMVSLQAFQRNVESKGNFLFTGTMSHLQKLKLKLYEQTRTCEEIRILGWQKAGFWAWSNGIINDGEFQEIDEYGRVKYENQDYFIPAFSKIYLADKSVFLDERKFQYKNSKITILDWSDLFVKVFKDNAKIAISFWIATIFRDHLLHIFKNFPILNLFGPKGTGKSQMAMSMNCLFGIQQTPFNIHNGTKAGLAEHIQQFSNAFAWIDEYKNTLDYDKIETLKSIYDAIGRSRMNLDKGRKKETTEVNSGVILSGQEMTTIDVALFSRVVFLQFHQTEFSKEEKSNYEKLKSMESSGLPHLTTEIIKHRKYFIDNYYSEYDQVITDFSYETESDHIEDRILRNMCTIVSAFKTLEQKIDFGFSYSDLRHIALISIRDQNSQISKSNELGIFWHNIEAMFDEDILIEDWHFRLNDLTSIKLKNSDEIKFNTKKSVLRIKYNSIYKLYAESARKQGIKPMPSDTLGYYLKKHKHFLGIARSCKFVRSTFDKKEGKFIDQKQTTTAYCFDYEFLAINLERKPIGMPAIIEDNMGMDEKVPDDDLHF
jgi:DNA primase